MVQLNATSFAYNEDLFHYGLLFSQTIGSAINLFTLFIIYAYKGEDMKSYRWHLFLYQFFSGILDFGMDTLTQPVFFFPHAAGAIRGWFRTIFGLSTFAVYVFMMTGGSVCLHFITFSPLYYRWQIILPPGSKMKFKSDWSKRAFQWVQFLIIHCILYSTLNMAYESKEQARIDFVEHNPQDAFLVEVPGFYPLDVWNNKLVFWSNICTLILLFYIIILVGFMGISCVHCLNETKAHMSLMTRQMHSRFLKNIAFQCSVPMLLIELPVLYWLICIIFDVRFPGHQDVTNFSVFLTCTHGVFGSFIVFYLNSSYRVYVARKFKNIKWRIMRKAPIESQPQQFLGQLSTSVSTSGI